MRNPSGQTPIEISTQKFLSLGISFILGKTIKLKKTAAHHEVHVALLELGILDVAAYATQEVIRFMNKFYTNPKVTNSSTLGKMINATKHLLATQPRHLERRLPTFNGCRVPRTSHPLQQPHHPTQKSDIKFFTTLACNARVIQASKHTVTMSRYLNSHFHASRDYLLHASRFFPNEISITALANFRMGTSAPLSTLAARSIIPYTYRTRCYFCNENILHCGFKEGHQVDYNYHDLIDCKPFQPQRTLINDILQHIFTLTPPTHPLCCGKSITM
jgi:hypothetical protein